jgi:nitrile hydratase beta subunit
VDGIHDLGGKHGFGEVEREANEPAFHAEWEAKVFALMMASGPAGAWYSADRFRHLIERIDPVSYLSDGYYGRWLGGIETGLVEAGVLTAEQISERFASLGGTSDVRVAARPKQHPDPMGNPPTRPNSDRPVGEPKFQLGDAVVTAHDVKPGHTRLPAYARGKTGRIIAKHDGWVYPDTNAHGLGEQPQHLYTVEFTGDTLWGGVGESMTLCLDLFEPYLILDANR